jgi:hypothetical protein
LQEDIAGEDPAVASIRKQRKAKQRQYARLPQEETRPWANETEIPPCMFAPAKTVFPTRTLFKNSIQMDYEHCYGAANDPTPFAEMDVNQLQGAASSFPTPAYPLEQHFASGADVNLKEAQQTLQAAPVQLQALYTDKGDMDFEESMALTPMVPDDTY